MIKKIIFMFLFITYGIIQASWSEKISSFGSEIGKKIVSHPFTSIATGIVVANVLPLYFKRQMNQRTKEIKRLEQLGVGTAPQQYRKLLTEQKYYKNKYESFSEAGLLSSAIIGLPAAATVAMIKAEKHAGAAGAIGLFVGTYFSLAIINYMITGNLYLPQF